MSQAPRATPSEVREYARVMRDEGIVKLFMRDMTIELGPPAPMLAAPDADDGLTGAQREEDLMFASASGYVPWSQRIKATKSVEVDE